MPCGRKMLCGLTVTKSRVGGATAKGEEALAVPYVAVINVLPTVWLVATPLLPTVAAVAFKEVHVATAVRSWVLPSA